MVYKEPLLDKLQRKFGRYAVHGLMNWIVMITAGVWVLELFVRPVTGFSLINLLSFSRYLISQGQIWRLFTFVFVPMQGSMLSTILSLYLYWLIGTTLEAQWGKFRFNVFYAVGVLGSVAAGLLTGYTNTTYLNLSMFLAFAILNPDFQLLLFFILPVKMKWVAALSGIGLVLMLITGSLSAKAALIMSMLNLILFFHREAIGMYKDWKRRRDWRKNWR